MKILILASNPRKDLNLDREIRDLKEVIKKSRNRRELEVEDALAVRVGELQDLLFRYRPQIVHFCGHGSGQQGLVFEGNDGGEQWVRAEALSDLFRLFAENVGCVLLNACYSEEQADAIVNHIDYVIGMNQEIRDDAAISFSKGFYRALGYGCSIEQAYEFGKNAIQLEISGSSKMRSAATEEIRKAEVVEAIQQTIIPEHLKPTLKIKPTLALDAKANVIAPEQPLSHATRTAIHLEIENALEADVTKQYRDRVREYLIDHRLTDFEKIRLEQLRKNLRLSVEEAQQILEEEEEALQKARDEYEEMLIRLIEEGLYPFSTETETNLQQLRQELQLTDLEVENVTQPVLQAAEKDYQERLRQQKKEHEDKSQRYKQELSRALQVEYPPSQHVADGLRGFWQQLGLKEEDVIQIEQPIRAPLEAKYQEQLKQRELAEKQRQAELELKRQKAEYESKLQRYEQGFARAVRAEYPLSQHVADSLKSFRQQLELKETDVAQIEQPIREPLEAKHQEQLRQQELARKQQQETEYQQRLKIYQEELNRTIELNYPLTAAALKYLEDYHQSLKLRVGDVERISKPILEQAEAKHQNKLKQQAEAERKRQVEIEQMRQKTEYTNKLQRYEQEFRKAIEAQYPLDSFVRHGLRQFQQSLKLSDADVAGIEEPIIAPKEAEAARLKQLKREATQKRQEPAKQPLPDALRGNYAHLEALLKAGKWKEADQETGKQMCLVMEQPEKCWLRVKDIEQFPYADLQTIDQLWVKYSNDRFGFGAQKKIWQQCGSPRDSYKFIKQWKKFGEAVGWRLEGEIDSKSGLITERWKREQELTFDTSAPEGHLPSLLLGQLDLFHVQAEGILSLLSRLDV
ncbi:GUN4 domain-containing protein [Leptolyngbya sp. ST-U4]|uniref:GUN4 domain-containing protein n=1 Tax=Leptolyngbya sp. ST-U4 TaxID=2933912 RepID=UPI00329A37CC